MFRRGNGQSDGCTIDYISLPKRLHKKGIMREEKRTEQRRREEEEEEEEEEDSLTDSQFTTT